MKKITALVPDDQVENVGMALLRCHAEFFVEHVHDEPVKGKTPTKDPVFRALPAPTVKNRKQQQKPVAGLTTAQHIAEYLTRKSPASLEEISAYVSGLGYNESGVKHRVYKMRQEGSLVRTDRGMYEVKKEINANGQPERTEAETSATGA